MELVLRDVRDSVASGARSMPDGSNRGMADPSGQNRGEVPSGGDKDSRAMGDAPQGKDGSDRAVMSELGSISPHYGDEKAVHPSETMRGLKLNESTGSRLPSERGDVDDEADEDEEGAKSATGKSEGKGPSFSAVRSDKPFAEEIPGLGKLLKGKATSQMPDEVDTSRPPSQFGDVVQPGREKSQAGDSRPGSEAGMADDAKSHHGGSKAPSRAGTHAGSEADDDMRAFGDMPDQDEDHGHHSHHSHPASHHGHSVAPSHAGSAKGHATPSKAGTPYNQHASLGDAPQSEKAASHHGATPDKRSAVLGDAPDAPKSQKAASHHAGTPNQDPAVLGDAPEDDGHSQKKAGDGTFECF